ncbi:MAG: glycosyltransferase family 2 protein [Bacteroidales bacterium]|nr:glycosyltransferase family 2 protein [Bacteroidales bacterium]
MDLSVIIVTYNSKDIIVNCLESIFLKTSGIDFEVIVVDNNSIDGTIDLVLNLFSDNVRIIKLGRNIGFGSANNEGVKVSIGRNLLFLNPDTVILNNALKVLSDYLDANQDTGAIGGNLFDSKLSPAYSYRRFMPSLLWELNDIFGGLPEKLIFSRNANFNHSLRCIEVAYITGADLMVSRHALDIAGTFDPVFFLFFEETDLCLRIRKSGYKIVSNPEARIQHLEGTSFAEEKNRIIFYLEGRRLFYSKNYPQIKHDILDFIFWINCRTRILLFTVLRNKDKKSFWETRVRYFRMRMG